MFLSLSHKIAFLFVNQIWYSKALNQYSMAHNIWFRLWKTLKQIERKLQYNETAFGDFQSFSGFSQKQFYICRLNLAF